MPQQAINSTLEDLLTKRMEDAVVKAPGVIKGFGEHAVVYGKIAIAVAIAMYARASVKDSGKDRLDIRLLDFGGMEASFDMAGLKRIYDAYKDRKDMQTYIQGSSGIDIRMLPYATIAARLANEFGVDVTGKEVEISSEIPRQSGCASSAACSTAFAVALLKSESKKLEDKTVIDIARDGERVVHRSEGAGRIDVAASYFGGYVSTRDDGRREPIETEINMVLIDTGPKKSTAETVGSVRRLYDDDREGTEKKLDEIEKCAIEGLKALSKGDLKTGGRYMYRDQELLRELGVSSEGLDRAVRIARENGAYGAKLSGGGGGGMAVAICDDPDALVKVMERNGFKAYVAKVSLSGARDYLL